MTVPSASESAGNGAAAFQGSDDVEQARLDTYRLIALLLRKPPDATLLQGLAAMPVTADDHAPALARAWRALRDAAIDTDIRAVDDEFHDLLVGVGRGELLPYGSWYLTGFLMDKPLVGLKRDLRQLGITRADDVTEPEDHAAALCETMALIGEAGAASPASQQQFFTRHIDPWMSRFFNDMRVAKSARFYRAVGNLGHAFLDMERTWLSLPA